MREISYKNCYTDRNSYKNVNKDVAQYKLWFYNRVILTVLKALVIHIG